MAFQTGDGVHNTMRCFRLQHDEKENDDHGSETVTSQSQKKVEATIRNCFRDFIITADINDKPQLLREKHAHFLKRGLQTLSGSYECLDSSRPWLCYWILHALELLGEPIPDDTVSAVSNFLRKCQHPEGGFGGGPGQLAHLATTYAAVNALCIMKCNEAYDVIDRKCLQSFLERMHQPEGGFIMHEGGELDIRGAYCAVSTARLTNISTPEMFKYTPEWLSRCQTYEGGFAGEPGLEAHGGYSFCGLAALILLGHERLCDLKNLLRWATSKQMKFEGGFQGRTNKLVDSCYTFWIGGIFPIIHSLLHATGDESLSSTSWMFHQQALQEYILLCCQYHHGGLIDKPGKPTDFYHTSYALSGLSVAQHFAGGDLSHDLIVGNPENSLVHTHPLYNIGLDATLEATSYFSSLAVPTSSNK